MEVLGSLELLCKSVSGNFWGIGIDLNRAHYRPLWCIHCSEKSQSQTCALGEFLGGLTRG